MTSHVGAFDLIRMSNREIDRLMAHVKKCEDWFTDQVEGRPVSDLWPRVQEEEVSDGYAAFHLSHLFEAPEDGIDEEYDEDEEDDEEDEIPEEPIHDTDHHESSMTHHDAECYDDLDDYDDDDDDDEDEGDMEVDEDEAKRIYLAMQGLGPAGPAAPTASPSRRSAAMSCESLGIPDRLLAQPNELASPTRPCSPEVPAAPVLHDHSYMSGTAGTPVRTSPVIMRPPAAGVVSQREPVIKTIYMSEEQIKRCTSGKRYLLVLNYPNRKTGTKVVSSVRGSIHREEVSRSRQCIIPPCRRGRRYAEVASVDMEGEGSTTSQNHLDPDKRRHCPRAVVKPTIHPLTLPHHPVMENKILALTSKTYSRTSTHPAAKTIVMSPPSDPCSAPRAPPHPDHHLLPPTPSPETCDNITTIIVD